MAKIALREGRGKKTWRDALRRALFIYGTTRRSSLQHVAIVRTTVNAHVVTVVVDRGRMPTIVNRFVIEYAKLFVSGKFRLMMIVTFRVFAKQSVTFTWPRR